MKKTIVIFANSVKHQQHCVAGKCINTKEWIRPVSNENGGELSYEQVKYKNKYGEFKTKPLQKIKMNLEKHVPLINQPENFLVGTDQWEQEFSIDISDIRNWLDDPNDLWGDDNRVDFSEIESGRYKITQSIYLIEVDSFNLLPDPKKNNKKRGRFTYKNKEYDLPITDPNLNKSSGLEKENSKIFLCISLGEPFNGYCYKIIAGIFRIDHEDIYDWIYEEGCQNFF